MTIPSFTAGGHTLPGSRASILLALALFTACSAPASTPGVATTAPAVASAAETPLAVPTLGTKPPTGLVFQTYFVTVTASGNGSIAVLTAPATKLRKSAACLNMRREIYHVTRSTQAS